MSREIKFGGIKIIDKSGDNIVVEEFKAKKEKIDELNEKIKLLESNLEELRERRSKSTNKEEKEKIYNEEREIKEEIKELKRQIRDLLDSEEVFDQEPSNIIEKTDDLANQEESEEPSEDVENKIRELNANFTEKCAERSNLLRQFRDSENTEVTQADINKVNCEVKELHGKLADLGLDGLSDREKEYVNKIGEQINRGELNERTVGIGETGQEEITANIAGLRAGKMVDLIKKYNEFKNLDLDSFEANELRNKVAKLYKEAGMDEADLSGTVEINEKDAGRKITGDDINILKEIKGRRGEWGFEEEPAEDEVLKKEINLETEETLESKEKYEIAIKELEERLGVVKNMDEDKQVEAVEGIRFGVKNFMYDLSYNDKVKEILGEDLVNRFSERLKEIEREIDNLLKSEIKEKEIPPEISEKERIKTEEFADRVNRILGEMEVFKNVKIDKFNKDRAWKAVRNYEIIKSETSQKNAEDFYMKLNGYYDEYKRIDSEIKKIESSGITEETPDAEPKPEKEKEPENLREEIKKAEKLAVKFHSLAEEIGKKIAAEVKKGGEVDDDKVAKIKKLEGVAALFGGVDVTSMQAIESHGLSPRKRAEELSNIVPEFKMAMEKVREFLGESLTKAEKSLEEELRSKSPEVQTGVDNLAEASGGRVVRAVDKVLGYFGERGSKKLATKELEKIKKVKSTDELAEIAENLAQNKKLKEETRELFKEIKESFLESSSVNKLKTKRLESWIEDMDNTDAEWLKEISKEWRGVAREMLVCLRIEKINDNSEKIEKNEWGKIEEKIGELINKEKDELESELKDVKKPDDLKSIFRKLDKIVDSADGNNKNFYGDQAVSLIVKLIKFENSDESESFINSLKNRNNKGEIESIEGIKKYIKKYKETIENLNSGALKDFMREVFDKIGELSDENGEGEGMGDEDLADGNEKIESINSVLKNFSKGDKSILGSVIDELVKKNHKSELLTQFADELGNAGVGRILEKIDKETTVKELAVALETSETK